MYVCIVSSGKRGACPLSFRPGFVHDSLVVVVTAYGHCRRICIVFEVCSLINRRKNKYTYNMILMYYYKNIKAFNAFLIVYI